MFTTYMHGLAVLLIPFAVMAFALGMERLQGHLDITAPEPDLAVADLADLEAFTSDVTITAQDATPAPDQTGNHLRRAS